MRPLTSRPLVLNPALHSLNSISSLHYRHNQFLLPHHLLTLKKWRSFSFSAPPPPQPTSSSSRCHIFWDLDNVQPTTVDDIPVIGNAIKTALLDLITSSLDDIEPSLPPPPSSMTADEFPPSSPPLLQLAVFANPTTLQKFSPTEVIEIDTNTNTNTASLDLHLAVEQILGGTLVLTTGRKQAVDFAMKSAMIAYVQEERQKILHNSVIIIACVSDDTDYVQVLEYLGSTIGTNRTNSSDSTAKNTDSTSTTNSISSSVGVVVCRTVSIGEHQRRKRPAWARPRKLESLALPAACDAAITLNRPRKNISPIEGNAENTNIDETRSNISGGDSGDNLEDAEGWGVATVWINPKRNWKERKNRDMK